MLITPNKEVTIAAGYDSFGLGGSSVSIARFKETFKRLLIFAASTAMIHEMSEIEIYFTIRERY